MSTTAPAATSPARAPRSAAPTLTGLNGWRALAALSVISAHVWTSMDLDGDGFGPGTYDPPIMWVMQNLDIVLDLFFVLSGMLIWLPFAAAILSDRAPIPRGGVFFVRRISRFLPLYIMVVLFCWALHNYNVAKADWLDLAEHLTLTQSLDSKRIFYTVGPAWTMSVEWFFYLACAFLAPGFVRLIRRLGHTPATRALLFVAGTAPILLASLAFKAYVAGADIPVTDWAWRFGPASKADIFILGMWTGTLIVALRGRRLPWFVLPVLVGVAIWGYAQVIVPGDQVVDHNLYHEVTRHTIASAGFCLVLFGLTTSRWQTPAKLIDNPVFLPLSVIAYSVYILHEGLINFTLHLGIFSHAQTVNAYLFNLTVVLLITIPTAWFFYRTIEVPWGRLGSLLDSTGRRKEFYPHLVTPVATEDTIRLSSHLSNHRRRAGRHFGPSPIAHGVAERLDAGAAFPAVVPEIAAPGAVPVGAGEQR